MLKHFTMRNVSSDFLKYVICCHLCICRPQFCHMLWNTKCMCVLFSWMAIVWSPLSPTSSQFIFGREGTSFHNKLKLNTLVDSPSKGFAGSGSRGGGRKWKQSCSSWPGSIPLTLHLRLVGGISKWTEALAATFSQAFPYKGVPFILAELRRTNLIRISSFWHLGQNESVIRQEVESGCAGLITVLSKDCCVALENKTCKHSPRLTWWQ